MSFSGNSRKGYRASSPPRDVFFSTNWIGSPSNSQDVTGGRADLHEPRRKKKRKRKNKGEKKNLASKSLVLFHTDTNNGDAELFMIDFFLLLSLGRTSRVIVKWRRWTAMCNGHALSLRRTSCVIVKWRQWTMIYSSIQSASCSECIKWTKSQLLNTFFKDF